MKTDFLVIGSGIAGLNFALQAAEFGEVLIVTKKDIAESNTNYAQGGIAAVLDRADQKEKHIEDTLIAGSFHNDKEAVKIMVEEGPELVRKLAKIVPFQKDEKGEIKLTKEGGHSARRIAFCGDATGYEIEKALVSEVRGNKKITVLEHTFVADLIKKEDDVIGALMIDKNTGEMRQVFSRATILASGGIGQIYYPHTTNPDISTGDGMAMGLQAGCRLKDMEFFQFHPTALFVKGLPTFLLSESLRGEGAKLINHLGESFMQKYDDRLELAPRDIVARAIAFEEMNGTCFLDMRHFTKGEFENHFKKIYKTLLDYGLNPLKKPIPISPAAHYTIGGIKVDYYGFTGINRLYAFGEVACTGVHGANRLGSNSLLEALVFSQRVVNRLPKLIKNEIMTTDIEVVKNYPLSCLDDIQKIRDSVTLHMWRYAGVIRSKVGLRRCLGFLYEAKTKLDNLNIFHKNFFETRNMLSVGIEVVKAAMGRKQSLGAHYITNNVAKK